MRGQIGRTTASGVMVMASIAVLSSVVTATLPIVAISWGVRHVEVPIIVALAAIGGLLLRRRPDNVVSWLLAVSGLAASLQLLWFNYGVAAAAWGWKGGAWASLAGDVVWPVIVITLFWALMRFPNGTPARGFGRGGDMLAVVGIVVGIAGEALIGGPVGYSLYEHPHPVVTDETAITLLLTGVMGLAIVACISGAVVNLVTRMRTARGIELQQLRWVRAAVVAALLSNGLLLPIVVISGRFLVVLTTVSMLSFLVVLIAIGIAILRYRLYDLDRVVSRTILYVTLTALTVGVYATTVLGLSALLRAMTGSERSSLVVAASTLVAAAVASPMRTRLQTVIDHRLYRARFDAQRAAAGFGATVRDLATAHDISEEIRDVLAQTLQPSSVGIWLADAEDARARQDAP